MGAKHAVPYGLYVGYGHFSAPLAARTGVTPADLETFWRAFTLMLEHDRAATRGEMTLRGLYVFSHDDRFGCVPAQDLFDRVTVTRVGQQPPRSYGDYTVELPGDGDLPAGVTLTRVHG
jgi:CRISPR-associated protein Csd2